MDAIGSIEAAQGIAAQPRAEGEAVVAVRAEDGRTRLSGLRQQGSARCMLPRLQGRIEAVFLNTAGGLTGGDRFRWRAEAGAGATLAVTTQAAERLYRAQPGQTAEVTTRLVAGAGSRLGWLPQETIAFDRCALRRRLEADIAEDATFLVVEPLVLGRAAMGETVGHAVIADHWRIRRGGRLVHAESLRLAGPVAETAARAGVFGRHRAAATILYLAPDAEHRLDLARDLLPGSGEVAEAGASAWDGKLVARILAPDGQGLRRALIRFLTGFGAFPLPRVWAM